ncbi:MAG: sulfite exporter TauE/SafE family protein [Candidatus Zophobacter franzmannii]|nr:sulfite exporter TauE/SafE family protein [Candidatus Zophobacter franzmannii]
MFKTLAEGFILGLTTGTVCLVSCTPIYLPFIVSEKRSIGKNLYKVFEISAGRFFSYLAFGAMAGWLGGNIAAIDRTLFTGIAYILLTVFMLLSFFRLTRKDKSCHIPKFVNVTKSAFLLGVFTGINFCPSFLIALSKAVDLAGPISGVMLFLGFFFGTSLFLLPLAFTGFLSHLKIMKVIARYASIAVALYFLYSGVNKIIHYTHSLQARIIDPISEEYEIKVFAPNFDSPFYSTLIDSLTNIKGDGFEKVITSKLTEEHLSHIHVGTIILIDPSLEEDSLAESITQTDHYILNPEHSAIEVVTFLRTYSIKVGKNQYLKWEF